MIGPHPVETRAGIPTGGILADLLETVVPAETIGIGTATTTTVVLAIVTGIAIPIHLPEVAGGADAPLLTVIAFANTSPVTTVVEAGVAVGVAPLRFTGDVLPALHLTGVIVTITTAATATNFAPESPIGTKIEEGADQEISMIVELDAAPLVEPVEETIMTVVMHEIAVAIAMMIVVTAVEMYPNPMLVDCRLKAPFF